MLWWFFVFLVILAAGGIIYQAAATASDNRNYPPPGQFVDIDGRRLHLVVSGENESWPTVILEAGIASFSSNWYWVQTELSSDTRVVSYDRAGLGWSDAAPSAQDAYASAADLHQALEEAGVSGPYVVAGHSYGGLVTRAFTDLYPDEVVGMVLVDASHPEQWTRMPASRNGRVIALGNRVTGWLAHFGVVRLFGPARALAHGLPDKSASEINAILNQPQSWATSAGVLAIWQDQTRPRVNQAHSLDDLPLVVMGVSEQPYNGDVLTNLQAELVTLSSNSRRTIVEGATHEGLISEREYALVVVEAIRQVLEASQMGRPLPPTSGIPALHLNE